MWTYQGKKEVVLIYIQYIAYPKKLELQIITMTHFIFLLKGEEGVLHLPTALPRLWLWWALSPYWFEWEWSENENEAEKLILFFMKGGSLGLFVGFSFFALWDIIKDWATISILSAKWCILCCIIGFVHRVIVPWI